MENNSKDSNRFVWCDVDLSGLVSKYWFLVLAGIACLSGVVLILRGVPWGADSFAYLSVSCFKGGQEAIIGIHSPSWFIWFLQNILSCNIYLIAFFQSFAYFVILVSLYFMGRHFFNKKDAWRFPIYCACLTPLFFIESIRMEHEIYGIAFAFFAICLFLLVQSRFKTLKSINNLFLVIISIVFMLFCAFLSFLLWLPSILILCFGLFFLKIEEKYKKIGLVAIIIVFLFFEWGYLLGSFNFVNIVAEELPLIGLVFVLHIIHFWKYIPGTLKFYALFLLFFGALKSKYVFLVSPLLCIGVLDKQLKKSISLKRELFGVKEIPVLYVCFILMFGWFLMGLNMYPTQTDLNEMKYAISYSLDTNQLLYNTWGDGWTFVSLGFDSNYKISPPNPDWNNLEKPFLAWSKTKLLDCNLITNTIQQC